MTYDLCVDIGGTFTDLYIRNREGTTDSFKAPTTPDEFTNGLFDVLQKAAESYGTTIDGLLGETERFVHGTTVSTNAIIERDTAATALITTAGFRDVLWLRPEIQKDTYEWKEFPDPLIPRWLTYGVSERVTAEGTIETELDDDAVRATIDEIRSTGVDAVAVSLLWSHANPIHEQRIGELLDELAPGVHYSLSHEINPIVREHRRTSSAAINAGVHDLVNSYLSRLSDELRARGFDGSPLIITANGGVMESSEVADRPIWTVDSGPTMLPVAARAAVSREFDSSNIIALDMGGTSLDMCVVTDGRIPRDPAAEIGDHYVLGIDKVGVKSIGSGGGSIARVDNGGLLHVGPESAGANPGPVCYGLGNSQPTVTDAAIVLGYLDPNAFLGGEMTLNPDAADTAIASQIADPLGIDTIEAAHSIYGTTVQTMVSGIREITVEQGIDPRNYVVAGGGGALGLFAVALARELGVEDILLPAEAGVVSAIGGLSSELRQDFVASEFTDSVRFDAGEVNEVLADLESGAREFFVRAGFQSDDGTLDFFVDARYPQQVAELQIELPSHRVAPSDVDRIVDRFHEVHRDTYGYAMETEDVEFLKWRVEASGPTPQGHTPSGSVNAGAGSTGRASDRVAFFDDRTITVPAYRSESLDSGRVIDGPGFIDDANMTVVLPPDSNLTVTEAGNYRIST